MEPKYKVGDTFYLSRTESERRQFNCPDCLGTKAMRVIAPSGDEFTMDCPRCSGRAWIDREIPSLVYIHHVPKVVACIVTGYSVNSYGSGEVEYSSSPSRGSSWTVKERDFVSDVEIAERSAQAKANEANEKQNATLERMKATHFKALKLREATDDMFANGLYDAWSAFRFLRETVDEIIGEEGENMTPAEIRESLEERLGDTMRYGFVFKGFVQFMETMGASLAGDEAATPLMIERWHALPERLRTIWKARSKQRWTGEEIPSY